MVTARKLAVSEILDMLVVGGGINGVGIARDAAGRGLSVRLVEKGALAAATSSASSKLIHGGLRYLEQSVARARAMPAPQPGDGPIVLLDHYDNCASGGTMDTTVVLAEILRQGLQDVVAFAIYDLEAVQQAIAAGIGAEVSLSIGGKIKMA